MMKERIQKYLLNNWTAFGFLLNTLTGGQFPTWTIWRRILEVARIAGKGNPWWYVNKVTQYLDPHLKSMRL